MYCQKNFNTFKISHPINLDRNWGFSLGCIKKWFKVKITFHKSGLGHNLKHEYILKLRTLERRWFKKVGAELLIKNM